MGGEVGMYVGWYVGGEVGLKVGAVGWNDGEAEGVIVGK